MAKIKMVKIIMEKPMVVKLLTMSKMNSTKWICMK
jgi:hypothetical protein